jgi:hypothetical protein
MITRDDRDILRKTLAHGPKTTSEVGAAGWGPGAWGKLKEFMAAGYTERVGNPKPPFKDMSAVIWGLTPDGACRLAESEPVASTERFLRYGAWCACERSCNGATLVLEAGVSVYDCHAVGSCWRPIDSRALSKNEQTLQWSPWFLVAGDVQAGVGSDGEPLLKNVSAMNSLAWDSTQGHFAVLPLGGFQNKKHPGHGTSGGCSCR